MYGIKLIVEVVCHLNVSEVVQCIVLGKSGMSQACASWSVCDVSDDYKELYVEVCRQKCNSKWTPNFWSSFITCDESGIIFYDPDSEQHSVVWKCKGSGPPRKFCTAALSGNFFFFLTRIHYFSALDTLETNWIESTMQRPHNSYVECNSAKGH